MTKSKAGVLSIIFGLGLCVGPLAVARTSFAQDTANHSKKSRKAYTEPRDERAKEDNEGAKEGAEEEQGTSFDGNLRAAMSVGESGLCVMGGVQLEWM